MCIARLPANLPEYDRHDWKHCTDADGDCQHTRNEVLVVESQTAVSFKTDRRCRVAAGQWFARYTNSVVTNPSKLDVDHMVPFGNAYTSGAWNWSAAQRERYANHLEDPQHLIASTASANRSKGALGPDGWKPDDRSYWCGYAIDRIRIKDAWDLTFTQREYYSTVAEMLDTCANRPELAVSQQTQAGPTPVPSSDLGPPTPGTRTCASCDAAQAASETRVQSHKGGGKGFLKAMALSPQDRDGVVCEK